jgi:hypothetical protein
VIESVFEPIVTEGPGIGVSASVVFEWGEEGRVDCSAQEPELTEDDNCSGADEST